MAKLFNLARMSTATTGTGTITLGSAISGFLSFADSGVSDGDVVTYAISDGSSGEIGRGTYTSSGTTLSRDTILASTNSGSAITLSGSAQVIISGSANDFYERDGRKNYIVNPGVRISQENGTTSDTVNGYYPVDQFLLSHSQDGTLTVAQVASATPGGSTHRIRLTVTSPDASIAASQYAIFAQGLEGLRVADLKWGTANAKDIVIRFGWKSPAGTYALAVLNQDSNRTFIREFTISGGDANTDTVQTLTIPGDTSGTWDSDNTMSINLIWTLAVGSTLQTTAGSWQSGAYFGTSSTSNGIGTGSDVFELFDIGMYADPDSTGIAPEFELPHYDDDLYECRRYYRKLITGSRGYAAGAGGYTTETYAFDPPMRATPSMAHSGHSLGNASSVTTAGSSAEYLTIFVNAIGAGDSFALFGTSAANARL
jgi:hypothetical protein